MKLMTALIYGKRNGTNQPVLQSSIPLGGLQMKKTNFDLHGHLTKSVSGRLPSAKTPVLNLHKSRLDCRIPGPLLHIFNYCSRSPAVEIIYTNCSCNSPTLSRSISHIFAISFKSTRSNPFSLASWSSESLTGFQASRDHPFLCHVVQRDKKKANFTEIVYTQQSAAIFNISHRSCAGQLFFQAKIFATADKQMKYWENRGGECTML